MASDRKNRLLVPMPVRFPLDTANPITDRAPGVLTDATDVHTRYWGPRGGFKTLEYPHDMDFSNGWRPTPSKRPVIFDEANSEYLQGSLACAEQWNLPKTFTLDVLFQPDNVASQSATDLQIFEWRFNGSYSPIVVNLKSDQAISANRRKVEVVLTSSSAPGTAGSSVTLTSSTQLSVGTAATNRHWIRVTREVGTTPRFRLYVDGTQEAMANKGSTDEEWEAAEDDTPMWFWSKDSGGANTRFDGTIYQTTLRNGAIQADVKAGFADFLHPRSDNVIFHVVNSSDTAYGHKDFSGYGAHQTLGTSTLTGSDYFDPPFMRPVQGMATFEDTQGRVYNVVMAGGALVWDRVT